MAEIETVFFLNYVGHGLQLKVEKDPTEQHEVEKPAFVMVLDWSACSPDLSSIDNGWQIMNHNKGDRTEFHFQSFSN